MLKKARQADGADSVSHHREDGDTDRQGWAPKTFSAAGKRWGMVALLLFVNLFWNGIVFGLLFRDAWLEGGGIFIKLFSLPFIAIGLLLVLGLFYAILALFNPRPVLTLEPGEPELGGRAFLRWHFKGSTWRVKRMRIIVRGVESATYTRGTSTSTDTKCFYAAAVADENQSLAMNAGSAEISIPSDLMYSLNLTRNAVVWKLEVKGKIGFWPDVNDEFEFTVRPHPKI